MTYYTVTLRLDGGLADAVAVEWTNQSSPVDSGAGWEPCLRRADGSWRFSSSDRSGAEPPHRRGPGPFAGLAIRYRLQAAGAWSFVAEPRKSILIEEGEDRRALLIAAPAVVAAPALAGAGLIGDELTVDPGGWTGTPAPQIAFQWRRDGIDVPGAAARAYLVQPQDDGCELACAVRAGNVAGVAVATAGPVRARHAPPRLVGALPEEVFDEAAGAEPVETAFVFAGENLSFAAEGATIDPRTGVVSVPTDRPVSGAKVAVTASNSGGAIQAVLRYTVEAAPARTLGAADARILRSVWRPAGQTRTFSPEVAFPGLVKEAAIDAIQFCADPLDARAPVWHPVRPKAGEAGTWQLFAIDHPTPAGAPDAALWQDDARRTGRLRFRWRATPAQPFSDWTVALDVPLPPAPAVVARTLPPPSNAMLRDAMSWSNLVFDPADDTGVNRPRSAHNVIVAALGALNGSTQTVSGKTPAVYVRDQIVAWGDSLPWAEGGIRGQRDFPFLCTAALARRTPAVWDGLSPQLRRKIDRVVEGLLVSFCWQMSDTNPNVVSRSNEVTIRGASNWGRGYNPNFILPGILGPSICAAYMGGTAAATAFLDRFDSAAFAAAVTAENASPSGCLTALWDTFRQTWAGGPTAAQLQGAVRNFRMFGHSLDQTTAIVAYALGERMWSKTIKVGLTLDAKSEVPNKFPAPTPGEFGIFEPALDLSGPGSVGRGAFVGRIPDKTAWAGLPNAGKIGMAFELDSNDGNQNGSGGGPRSSMSYAHEGAVIAVPGVAALAACDMLDRRNAAFREALDRQTRGVTDMKYRNQHGHRDFSKGGWPYVGSGNEGNGDWDTNGRVAQWKYGLIYDLHETMILPWAG